MKNLIFSALVCAHTFAISQENVSWCLAAGDQGVVNFVDAAGNNYFGGRFQGTRDFDPGTAVYDLTSNGLNDCFIVKLDNQGNFLWAGSFGGSNYDNIYGIRGDAAGNIYMTGSFNGITDFDLGPDIFNLEASSSDLYVLKLNSSGDFQWAVQVESNGGGVGFSLAVSSGGDVFVTGYCSGVTDLDPGVGEQLAFSDGGSVGAFVLKLDQNGLFVWVKTFSGVHAVQGYNVNLDDLGNIILTGSFSGTVDFDPGAGNYLLSSSENIIYVLKLDSNGNFLWANQFDGAHSTTNLIETVVAPDESIYISGSYSDAIDLDPGPDTTTYTSNGNLDVFVAKYNATGNLIWGGSFGGTDNDAVGGMTIDESGELFIAGKFSSSVDFDWGLGTHVESSFGQAKMYVLSFTTDGDFNSVKIMNSTLSIEPNALFAVSDNDLYITGIFSGVADFDAGFDQYNLTAVGSMDGFQLKLTCSDVSVVQNGFELTATTAATSTYQWVDCAAAFAPVSGETNHVFNAPSPGEYAVIVTQNGCADTSDCFTVSDVATTDYIAEEVSIFPNPSSGKFTVNVPNDTVLKVYNAAGEELHSTVIFSGNNNLDYSNLADGIYTLRIMEDAGNNYRIVITK